MPIARHAAARHIVVTDVNEYRLSLAKKMGASVALNVSGGTLEGTMRELGMEEGFDVGLEMSGSQQALDQMVESLVMGGRIALLGIPPGTVKTARAATWTAAEIESPTRSAPRCCAALTALLGIVPS
mgnify:CR=1 FL=1